MIWGVVVMWMCAVSRKGPRLSLREGLKSVQVEFSPLLYTTSPLETLVIPFYTKFFTSLLAILGECSKKLDKKPKKKVETEETEMEIEK